MKKVLAVMLTLVLAFTFCIPSFADAMQDIQDAVSSVLEQFDISQIDPNAIRERLEGILGNLNPGGSLPNLPNLGLTVSPDMAKTVIDLMQQQGTSKADIDTAIEQMYQDGQINEESYNNLKAALEAAPETPTNAAGVPESDVPEVAQRIIDALHQAGVTDEQMKSTVDDLHERGIIPDNVYNEITNILNAQEPTTDANSSGGIGDFFSGLFSGITDFFGGLFGNGDDGDGDDPGATGTPSGGANSTDFGANDATGDTMIASVASVAAVAAIAGVALVLTKKKKDQ